MNQLNDTTNLLSTELSRRRRELGSQSPRAFAEIYMTHNCNKPFSRMHEEMFGLLSGMTENRKARLAIAAPRGHAKSTIVSLVYVLWCVLYSKEKLVLIASNTITQATALLKDIKDQLKRNPLMPKIEKRHLADRVFNARSDVLEAGPGKDRHGGRRMAKVRI